MMVVIDSDHTFLGTIMILVQVVQAVRSNRGLVTRARVSVPNLRLRLAGPPTRSCRDFKFPVKLDHWHDPGKGPWAWRRLGQAGGGASK